METEELQALIAAREDSFVSPSYSVEEKHNLLASLNHLVDNPSFSLRPDEILDLISDLGLMCRNYSRETWKVNPDIFEDPMNRSDSLGNVRMIHKTNHDQFQIDILHHLGDHLCQTSSEFRKVLLKSGKLASTMEGLYPILGQFDDTESETILAGKRKIKDLRNDLFRAERKNSALVGENGRLRDKIDKLRSRLAIADQLNPYRSTSVKNPRPIRSEKSIGQLVKQPEMFGLLRPNRDGDLEKRDNSISCRGNCDSIDLTRNEKKDSKVSSQLSCLEW
jgi:hypothetical protein